MRKALLMIDIQNFYFGENGLEGCIEASLKAQRLLCRFRELGLPVIHIKHDKDVSLLPDEQKKIVDIHENVRPIEGETIIWKKTPGSFNGTILLDVLKQSNIDELVICGMMSNMCVDTTTREAFDLNFNCTVIHDACATRAYHFNGKEVSAACMHAAAMASLAYRFAKVINCDELLHQM